MGMSRTPWMLYHWPRYLVPNWIFYHWTKRTHWSMSQKSWRRIQTMIEPWQVQPLLHANEVHQHISSLHASCKTGVAFITAPSSPQECFLPVMLKKNTRKEILRTVVKSSSADASWFIYTKKIQGIKTSPYTSW